MAGQSFTFSAPEKGTWAEWPRFKLGKDECEWMVEVKSSLRELGNNMKIGEMYKSVNASGEVTAVHVPLAKDDPAWFDREAVRKAGWRPRKDKARGNEQTDRPKQDNGSKHEVFLAGLRYGVMNFEVEQAFEEAGLKKPSDVLLVRAGIKSSAVRCFVTCESKEDVAAALRVGQISVGAQRDCATILPRQARVMQRGKVHEQHWSEIPLYVQAWDIREICRKQNIGVTGVVVARNYMGQSLGHAKVTFEKAEEATKSLRSKVCIERRNEESKQEIKKERIREGVMYSPCDACGKQDHLTEPCQVKIEQRKPTCYNCGDKGHMAGACLAPKRETRTCYRCGVSGHISRECSVEQCCRRCCSPEHKAFECPEGRTCFGCGKNGHLVKDCLEKKERRSCYNCREVGHLARECKQKRRNSVECHFCGETGHVMRDCPSPHRRGNQRREEDNVDSDKEEEEDNQEDQEKKATKRPITSPQRKAAPGERNAKEPRFTCNEEW
eukprot:Lithocolla_globosa_v1_NODE_22_length_9343_cov_54.984819.p2 type:complete len:496 gc:universal NODE_22_length_9343_cov_54.984819:3500-4987(+)